MKLSFFLKITLITLLVHGAPIFIKGLSGATVKYEAGIGAGINSSRFLNDHMIDIIIPKDARIRPVTGIFVRHYPAEHVFMEFQISYSPEGGGFVSRATNLNYIRNQLTLGLTSTPSRKNVFYFGLAYNLNFRISAVSVDLQNNSREKIPEFWKNSYQGIGLNAGYKRKITKDFYLRFDLVTQLYSTNLYVSDHLQCRQIILPAFQTGFIKVLK